MRREGGANSLLAGNGSQRNGEPEQKKVLGKNGAHGREQQRREISGKDIKWGKNHGWGGKIILFQG